MAKDVKLRTANGMEGVSNISSPSDNNYVPIKGSHGNGFSGYTNGVNVVASH